MKRADEGSMYIWPIQSHPVNAPLHRHAVLLQDLAVLISNPDLLLEIHPDAIEDVDLVSGDYGEQRILEEGANSWDLHD